MSEAGRFLGLGFFEGEFPAEEAEDESNSPDRARRKTANKGVGDPPGFWLKGTLFSPITFGVITTVKDPWSMGASGFQETFFESSSKGKVPGTIFRTPSRISASRSSTSGGRSASISPFRTKIDVPLTVSFRMDSEKKISTRSKEGSGG